jgi:hypothetical protein
VILASVLFAVTRLALLCLIAEFALLAAMIRTRRALMLVLGVTALSVVILFSYPSIGPVMDSRLVEGPSPTRFLRTTAADPGEGVNSPQPTASSSAEPSGEIGGIVSEDDPSIRAHLGAIEFGIRYVATHPLGTGLGSATPRYGVSRGPAESALLRIGGELGILGAALYLALYFGALGAAAAVWRRDDGWRRIIGLATLVGGLGLFPITLTSDVWGNFSVVFLFWWLAGLSVAIASAPPSSHPVSST